jgi:hypothetical protein
VATPDRFTPGLELARAFHREAIAPILADAFPSLAYASALVGYGSDVLGFDSERSTDHSWGPRGTLFLAEEKFDLAAERVRAALRAQLPRTFRGYAVDFTPAAPADRTRMMRTEPRDEVDPLIEVTTWTSFAGESLGRRRALAPTLLDWMTFAEASLLEVTAGEVFHDGLGTLIPARERFAYFPRDVWLHRMAAMWQRIAQEEPFVGRTAEAGDELGSRLLVGRLVRDFMRLAFLIERRYAPYMKWFGTAFSRLPCAPRLLPPLERAVAADGFPVREDALVEAVEELARMHNALDVTEPLEPRVRGFHDRPYRVIGGERFDAALRSEIENAEVRALPSLLGAVDQLIDCSSAAQSPLLSGGMRALYHRA